MRRALQRLIFRLYRALERLGVHVLPVHYYSAQPSTRALEATRAVWARRSSLPGLDADLDRQVETLREICLPWRDETAGNPVYAHAVEHGFGPGYGYVEAQALHAVVRHFRPRRVIEVGSGVSTFCLRHALERNARSTGGGFALTCVEPFPSAPLRAMEGVQLVEQPVQELDPQAFFADLGENDLLFIDSSHTVKPGSDVNFLVLEVLPRLRAGVVVHVHDIYLPYDYSPFVLKTLFHWSETALLRAFLTHNPHARVLFCQSQLHDARPEALREVHPEYRPRPQPKGLVADDVRPFETPDGHFPASLYFQTV